MRYVDFIDEEIKQQLHVLKGTNLVLKNYFDRGGKLQAWKHLRNL